MTLAIVNPLPTALEHYAKELTAVLQAAGYSTRHMPTPTIESARDGPPLLRSSRAVLWRWAFRGAPDEAVVLWPAFGLLDPVTFAGRRAHTWLILHDATPLRRQLGMGSWAGRLGRRALNERLTVIVHSEPARQVMTDRGWPVVVAPHPIHPPAVIPTTRGRQIRVLGQWKAARTMEPLMALAADQTLSGRREIVGRGWPDVPGWKVDARFLTEADLDRHISEAAAVVLPYDRYYQSGIAVRCLERHTPVVGRDHPFLADLFGAHWPGTVSDDDWPSAVARAAKESPEELARLHAAYWSRCVETWRGLLTRVG